MIEVGQNAPSFALEDHQGRKVSSEDLKGKCHIMLLFYLLHEVTMYFSEGSKLASEMDMA